MALTRKSGSNYDFIFSMITITKEFKKQIDSHSKKKRGGREFSTGLIFSQWRGPGPADGAIPGLQSRGLSGTLASVNVLPSRRSAELQ